MGDNKRLKPALKDGYIFKANFFIYNQYCTRLIKCTLFQLIMTDIVGQRFSLRDKNQDPEIRRRIKAGWQAFGRYSNIMKGNLPICLKRKVYNQCILPAISYGSETWTLTSKMEKKLAAAQHNMERSVLNITYKDRKTNKWIREQTDFEDILKTIKKMKWTWAGHISRCKDNRWSSAITQWTPYGERRNRGRQRKRWRDEVQKYWGQ